MMHSALDLVRSLDQRLAPLKMLTHLGLQSYVKRGMPLPVARRLATAYGPVNAASPAIMAAGLTRITNRELFYVLLRNLWEECGNGEIAESHVEMFERFTRAVGLEPTRELKHGSRGETLVDHFLAACRGEPEHRVLAMFHGFEATFPYVCGEISTALKVSGIVSAEDAHFFPFHAVHDLDHAATTQAAMLQAADTTDKRRDCLTLAVRGARLIFDLFDDVFTLEEELDVRR